MGAFSDSWDALRNMLGHFVASLPLAAAIERLGRRNDLRAGNDRGAEAGPA